MIMRELLAIVRQIFGLRPSRPLIHGACIFLVCMCVTWSAMAQGRLNFSNYAPGVDAPISDCIAACPCLDLAGPDYMAVLYYALGFSQPDAAMQPLLSGVSPSPFSIVTINARQGYFINPTPLVIPGTQAGSGITAQIRVWRIADGPDWETAAANSFGHVAKSSLINVTLTTAPSSPANLVGLQSFSILPVGSSCPEPSTVTLLCLGIVFIPGCLRRMRERKATINAP